jgi:predicted metallopeptidase
MSAYVFATEVAKVGADLIKKVPTHKPLAEVRVEYVFKPEASRSRGKLVLGKAKLVTGLNAFLAGDGSNDPFFVVEVAKNTWDRLTVEQRRALVDHELCHFVVTDDGAGAVRLSIRGHDLEEFAEVVERQGFWRSEIAAFGSTVAEQMTLALEEAATFLEDASPPDGSLPDDS